MVDLESLAYPWYAPKLYSVSNLVMLVRIKVACSIRLSTVMGLQLYIATVSCSNGACISQVGSNWDGKESIFRNYGGILGVWDEPVAAVRLTMGKQVEVVIIWEDPVGDQLARYTMKLEANWFVSYHKPKVEKPIRPGVWLVRLETKTGAKIMETKFLVVPVTHDNTKPLTNPQAANARRANSLHPGVDSKEFLTWRTNVAKAGSELEAWLDELMSGFWKLEGMCRSSDPEEAIRQCSWLPECSETPWSTLSPDPKSEIGEVQENGRIR